MRRLWGQKELIRQVGARLEVRPFGFKTAFDEALDKLWHEMVGEECVPVTTQFAPYEVVLERVLICLGDVALRQANEGLGPPICLLDFGVMWVVPSRDDPNTLVRVVSPNVEELVYHEVLENFYVDGIRVFDPHV